LDLTPTQPPAAAQRYAPTARPALEHLLTRPPWGFSPIGNSSIFEKGGHYLRELPDGSAEVLVRVTLGAAFPKEIVEVAVLTSEEKRRWATNLVNELRNTEWGTIGRRLCESYLNPANLRETLVEEVNFSGFGFRQGGGREGRTIEVAIGSGPEPALLASIGMNSWAKSSPWQGVELLTSLRLAGFEPDPESEARIWSWCGEGSSKRMVFAVLNPARTMIDELLYPAVDLDTSLEVELFSAHRRATFLPSNFSEVLLGIRGVYAHPRDRSSEGEALCGIYLSSDQGLFDLEQAPHQLVAALFRRP
jgi:hypothetical protein